MKLCFRWPSIQDINNYQFVENWNKQLAPRIRMTYNLYPIRMHSKYRRINRKKFLYDAPGI